MTDILPCVCRSIHPVFHEFNNGLHIYRCRQCERRCSAITPYDAVCMWNAAMSAPRLISMNRKYRTRGGADVVLYDVSCPRPENGQPVVGYVIDEDGESAVETWESNGRYNAITGQSILDLVEAME